VSETPVPASLAGERVDRVVALLTGWSRGRVAELIADGGVRIDGAVVATRSRRLEEGEVVAIDLPPEEPAPVLAGDDQVDVPVVHADDEVIVVDKPPGLVVHPGAGNPAATMVHGLLARFPELAGVGDADRPGLVHRLDQGTSGLLVVARTPAAYDDLVAQLSARTVERVYQALVWGHLDATHGVVDAPIGRSTREPTKMAVTTQGREARTSYRVLHAYHHPVAVCRLECRLETGRTHQIRGPRAANGQPVVGDARYGGARQSLPLDRPVLHAAELAFDHPGTGERVRYEAPLPPDLAAVLAELE
jgi:23S rRNA pseudouridine1911/1915/1917 synthase